MYFKNMMIQSNPHERLARRRRLATTSIDDASSRLDTMKTTSSLAAAHRARARPSVAPRGGARRLLSPDASSSALARLDARRRSTDMPWSQKSFSASEQSAAEEDADDASSSPARRERVDASASSLDDSDRVAVDASTDASREMKPATRRLDVEKPSASASAEASCLKRIGECTCNLSALDGHQAILATCANMMDREKREIEETEARVTREDAEHRMRALQCVRFHLVESMMRSGVMNGFSSITTALAVRYLDVFFLMSGYPVRSDCSWMYQLVASACLFIACKFEEPLQNIRSNIGHRLQSTNDISFDIGALKKMETIVLRELQWNVARVTPFNFVPYFCIILLDCHCAALLPPRGKPNHLHSRILREAEVLSSIVLYDCGVCCRFESSVIAKAILCIAFAKISDGVTSSMDVAQPIVLNILRKIHRDAHADDFVSIIDNVISCVRHIEGLKETLDNIYNTSQPGQQAQLQKAATPAA
jgi:hypothetical protein